MVRAAANRRCTPRIVRHGPKGHPIPKQKRRPKPPLIRFDRGVDQAMVTLAAWSPLGPSTTSNSTCAPSCRERKPLALMALKCTKTSSPVLVVMKPKPLASLNHLTVPLLRILKISLFVVRAAWGRFRSSASRSSQPQTAINRATPYPVPAPFKRGSARPRQPPRNGLHQGVLALDAVAFVEHVLADVIHHPVELDIGLLHHALQSKDHLDTGQVDAEVARQRQDHLQLPDLIETVEAGGVCPAPRLVHPPAVF